jgi:23S rRNA (pseudouridine1915-N3)-methyltransferase
VKISVALVARSLRGDVFAPALDRYVQRIGHYVPVEVLCFRSEESLFAAAERRRERSAPWLALLDPRGERLTSEQFAGKIGAHRDAGRQSLIFGIGPADGWSAGALKKAQAVLSLGPMTLSHELSRVVLAEQLYRACTILAGHPYHVEH